jgi:DNA-binding transcriptional LysR family regulator
MSGRCLVVQHVDRVLVPSIYHSLIVLHHKLDPDVGKAVKEAIDQRRQDVDHDGASDIQFHRLVDIIAAGCDAGIRYGEHLAQDMIAVPIGPPFQKLVLAASPRYLDERVPPVHPSDLLTHDCIRLRFSSGALTAWEFECGDQSVTVDPPGRAIPSRVDGHA